MAKLTAKDAKDAKSQERYGVRSLPCLRGSAVRPQPRSGLTLIEVVVALAILVIVMLAAFQVFGGSVKATHYTSRRLHALSLAQSVLETLQCQPFNSLPPERFVAETKQTYPWPLQLQHKDMEPGSARIAWSDGTSWGSGLQVDAASGAVTLQDPHRTGTFYISYQYRLPALPDWETRISGVLISTPSSPDTPMKKLQVEVRPKTPSRVQTPVILWTVRAG